MRVIMIAEEMFSMNFPLFVQVCASSLRSIDSSLFKDTMEDKKNFSRDPSKFNLLIGVTGSVATIKLWQIVESILKLRIDGCEGVEIRVVTTAAALHFKEGFSGLPSDLLVYTDSDEWVMWSGRDQPVLHVELRRWADCFLVAPLDANTMAKVSNGLCDNLLTCVVRCWDREKSLYFCPAMNTFMFDHPLTKVQIETLSQLLGYKEIPSVEKRLMCGDVGMGAMSSVETIANVIGTEIESHFNRLSQKK